MKQIGLLAATSSAETRPQQKSCLTDRYSSASSCALRPRLPCAVSHLDDGGENDDRSNGNPGRDRRWVRQKLNYHHCKCDNAKQSG